MSAPPTVSSGPLGALLAGYRDELVPLGPGVVPLDDAAVVAWVETGEALLFAVPCLEGRPEGPRRHIMTAVAGCLLPCLPAAAAAGWRLLAVPAPDARLVGVPMRVLQQLFQEHAGRQAIAVALDGWLAGLVSSIVLRPRPRVVTPLQPSGTLELRPGEQAQPAAGVVWCMADSDGAAHLVDPAWPLVASALTPVAAPAWVEADRQVALAVTTTAELLERRSLMPALRACQHAFLAVLALQEREQDAAALERITSRYDEQADAFATALQHLDATQSPKAPLPPPRARRSGWPAALGLVADATGAALPPAPPGAWAAGSVKELQAALATAGVWARTVFLSGRWWRTDSGALLGLLKDGSRQVALVPWRRGRYVMRDPEAGAEVVVDAAVAATLQPEAVALYRSFEPTPLRLKDVGRLGVLGLKRDIWAVAIAGLAVGILSALPALLTRVLFDNIIPSAEQTQLAYLVMALVVAAVSGGAFHLAQAIALLRIEGHMGANVQAAVWARLLSLAPPFFRHYSPGDLATRANAIGAIRQVVTSATLSAVLGSVFSLFNLGLMVYYDWRLTLWALLVVLVALILTVFLGVRSLRFARQVQKRRQRIAGLVLQLLAAIGKLRVAASEAAAFARWATPFAEQRRLQFRARDTGNWLAMWNSGIPIVASMVVFWRIAHELGQRPWATGTFLSFSAAFGAFLSAVIAAGQAALSTLQAIPLYESAKPILEAVPESSEARTRPAEMAGRIEVSQVSFRYIADGPLVLRDVTMRAEPGQFIAVVGPSGSGKSTLLRLLIGFERPSSGAILYDNHDLVDLDLLAVRRQMGAVLQHGRLLPASIFRNIAGASSQHTEDDAWEAAEAAGIAEDIRRLPMGMQTQVGEGGGAFSGGQRQRLLIARALVHRPRILLMDEATSALDNRTQELVTESLRRLRATRIVVAHRLSTIMEADRIFVLENGILTESGTYAELMDRRGDFWALARRQIV